MRHKVGFIVVLVLLLAMMGALFSTAFAADPAPQTVVGTKTVTLREAHLKGAATTAEQDVTNYGISDVFIDMVVITNTQKITPTIQASPDGGTWFDVVSLTAILTNTATFTRVANYGNWLRVSFAVSDTTRFYTPTVKVVLKNNDR